MTMPYGPPLYDPATQDPYADPGGLAPEDQAYLDSLYPDQGQFQPGQFKGSFLENFSGLEQQQHPQPRGFGEGFLYGLSGSLGQAGTRAQQSRQKFDQAETARRAAFDVERRQASRDKRTESGRILRENINSRGDEKKQRDKYLRETVEVKPDDPPSLRRIADPEGRVAKSDYLSVTKPPAERAPGRPMLIDTPNGPRYVTPEQAVGKAPPPPKMGAAVSRIPAAQQVQAVNFLDRATQADALATKLEDTGVRASRLTGKIPILGVPLEQFQGDPERQYWQTVRQFVESHLRKESGAAITDTELETAARTYFAQPGDSPALVKQKRAARQSVLAGLNRFVQAGSAESRLSSGGARNKQELADVKASALRSIQSGDLDTFQTYIDNNPDLDNDPELEAALDAAGVPR